MIHYHDFKVKRFLHLKAQKKKWIVSKIFWDLATAMICHGCVELLIIVSKCHATTLSQIFASVCWKNSRIFFAIFLSISEMKLCCFHLLSFKWQEPYRLRYSPHYATFCNPKFLYKTLKNSKIHNSQLPPNIILIFAW